MPIQILTAEVAAKIAAGEVVERPASVVKELVENAIDAGAGTIRVEVSGGGKRLISIGDDGSGIPADEVPLAFERHATSKLTSIDDLSVVKTLGFRGEALATIAAVSRLSMITRPREQTGGTRIRFEDSRRQSLGSTGAPVGTLISVENLFYNVPARLKFLKADATELAHIHRVVSHYAMAYPEIRFALTSSGRQVFQTGGTGELHDVLVAVWGLETAKEMMPVEGRSDKGIEVRGYIGPPSLHRGQRDQLVLFVNRRWIQDKALAHAVAQAYHTFLPIGRHPIAVLNITLDPAEVDVNVHPTKAEVKFREPGALFSAVQRPVRAALTDDAPLIRAAHLPGPSPADWSPTGHHDGHGSDRATAHSGPAWSQFGLEVQRSLPAAPLFDLEEPAEMPPLRVIGQIRQTYIITEGPDGLYLIDQHAAHERILYEKLMAQKERAAVVTQRLLNPLLLELIPAQIAVLTAEMETLLHLGFEIEPFGGNSFRLLAVPEMLAGQNLLEIFADILSDMADGAVPLARQTHDRVAIIVCKRASIKGGQTLSQTEMEALIRQLEQSQNPRTCPHGRPTMIHFSAYQLAKEFGRH